RWACGAFLLLQFFYVYVVLWGPAPPRFTRPGIYPPRHDEYVGRLSVAHVHVLAWEQLLLVVLITPGFVAGQITARKTRGTLQHLLTTALRSWEIVLGKLLAQGALLVALLAMTVPLLCFSALLGGMSAGPMLAHTAGMMLLVLLLGSASLLASVW